jgi:hypothetical protein
MEELTLFIESDWLTDELFWSAEGGLTDLPPLRLCFFDSYDPGRADVPYVFENSLWRSVITSRDLL